MNKQGGKSFIGWRAALRLIGVLIFLIVFALFFAVIAAVLVAWGTGDRELGRFFFAALYCILLVAGYWVWRKRGIR